MRLLQGLPCFWSCASRSRAEARPKAALARLSSSMAQARARWYSVSASAYAPLRIASAACARQPSARASPRPREGLERVRRQLPQFVLRGVDLVVSFVQRTRCAAMRKRIDSAAGSSGNRARASVCSAASRSPWADNMADKIRACSPGWAASRRPHAASPAARVVGTDVAGVRSLQSGFDELRVQLHRSIKDCLASIQRRCCDVEQTQVVVHFGIVRRQRAAPSATPARTRPCRRPVGRRPPGCSSRPKPPAAAASAGETWSRRRGSMPLACCARPSHSRPVSLVRRSAHLRCEGDDALHVAASR